MPRFSSIVVTFCLGCGLVLLLAACGQKGPLKLPDPAPAKLTSTAPVPQK